MAAKQTFTAVLEKHPTLNATSIKLPFDVEAIFGGKRVPVKAVVNGAVYRGSVFRMGGEYLLGIPKEFRDAAGIEAGERIEVTLTRDDEPRVVEIPNDLAAAFKENKKAEEAWDKLSYTHRKEHVKAILEAKRPETRARRVSKAVDMLTAREK